MRKEYRRQVENEEGIARLLAKILREKTMASSVTPRKSNSFVLVWPGGTEYTVTIKQIKERA